MQVCKTVTLRTRECRGGMLSYYLDYYPSYRDKETMKTIRHESLGIYIYANPRNKRELEFNRIMFEKAETIRCRKYEMVINERYKLIDKQHLKENFLEYFEKCAQKKTNPKLLRSYCHFCIYVNNKCTFEDVDEALCRGFADYLTEEAINLHTGLKMKINTAASYWIVFKSFIKDAYVSKQIDEDLYSRLPSINREETTRESLTLEEIGCLFQTECKYDVLKRASIFSCFTGLRFSDVQALTWDNIKEYEDGSKYLEFKAIKTKKINIIPIHNDVLQLMGEKSDGVVFKGFTKDMTRKSLLEWIEKAEIKKHITFHCFRHTYATLQIELGTDIYTVQSLLAHSDVATTQIYAKHSDARKREAAQRLSFGMLKSVSSHEKTKEKKENGEESI